MLRLSSFCMILGFVVAQSGYEYNKPGKPFNQGSEPNQNYSPSPRGFQGLATTPSYKYQGVKGDDYSNSGGSSQTSAPASGYPSGPNQGFPSVEKQNQPGYSSQTPSVPSFTGQGSNGPSSAFPGQTVQNYPGQDLNYPEQDQPNYQGQTGSPSQSGAPTRQNSPGQLGQISGNPIQNQPGGPNYARQPGQSNVGGPGQGSLGFNPSDTGFSQSNAGFGQTNDGFDVDNTGAYAGGDYSAIPGEPDVDYPILTEIPVTSFRCDAQTYPGYYADVETRCQVFHICANNRTYDFLCPNGTIFSQQVFVCVWWNQFDCNSAPGLYELNANLYDYSKTGSTSQNTYQPGLNDYSQAQQGQSAYPTGSTLAQGSSPNYSGNAGLSGYPRESGSQGYQGPLVPQEPDRKYPGTSGVQSSLPGFPGSQRPSTDYSNSAPQTPSNSYSGSAPQSPSNSYLGPQEPSTSYAGSGSRSPSSSYPGPTQGQSYSYPTSSPQGTSSSYPGASSASGSYAGLASQASLGYPGNANTQDSSAPYPGSSVTPGFSSSGVSQNQSSQAPSSYSVSPPNGNLGYPSGKPSGPTFPTGGRPQQPNREYLPPRN